MTRDEKLARARARLEESKKHRIDTSAKHVNVSDILADARQTLSDVREYRKRVEWRHANGR